MNERSKSKYGREYSLALDHISKDTSHLNKLQNTYFIASTTFRNRFFFPTVYLKEVQHLDRNFLAYSFTTHYVFVVQEKQENELFSLLLFLMYPAMSRSPTTQACQSSLWNPLSVLGTGLPVPVPSGRGFHTDPPSAAFTLTHCCPHLQTLSHRPQIKEVQFSNKTDKCWAEFGQTSWCNKSCRQSLGPFHFQTTLFEFSALDEMGIAYGTEAPITVSTVLFGLGWELLSSRKHFSAFP